MSMHKRVFAIAAAAIAVTLSASAPAAADPGDAPCPDGKNCWWSGENYSGGKQEWSWIMPAGTCVSQVGTQIQSYAFYGGQEGYFYYNYDCVGTGRPAAYDSENGRLGVRRSFKAACISCVSRQK